MADKERTERERGRSNLLSVATEEEGEALSSLFCRVFLLHRERKERQRFVERVRGEIQL